MIELFVYIIDIQGNLNLKLIIIFIISALHSLFLNSKSKCDYPGFMTYFASLKLFYTAVRISLVLI